MYLLEENHVSDGMDRRLAKDKVVCGCIEARRATTMLQRPAGCLKVGHRAATRVTDERVVLGNHGVSVTGRGATKVTERKNVSTGRQVL